MKCESCGWDIAYPKPEIKAGSTHRVGDIEKMNENKSWNEFIAYSHDYVEFSNYERLAYYIKIGLLIEYLKSKGFFLNNYIVGQSGCGLSVVALEGAVKSLKPKEEDEVEKLTEELYKENYGIRTIPDYYDKYAEGDKARFNKLARKAIEILRKK